MNRTTYFMVLVILLVFKGHTVYAADAISNTLPMIERSVIKISAVPSDDVFISIPRTAQITRNGIPGVFVVENNEARFRMVRPGKISLSQLEILSGLFGNETLVVGELEAVHDGSPIKVLKKKSAGKK